MKRYQFYYHYNRHKRRMSLHYRGLCYDVTGVLICAVPCHSHRRKFQPYFVMQGKAGYLHWSADGSVVISDQPIIPAGGKP